MWERYPPTAPIIIFSHSYQNWEIIKDHRVEILLWSFFVLYPQIFTVYFLMIKFLLC